MIRILNNEIIAPELIDIVDIEFWQSIKDEEPENNIKLIEAENDYTT